MSSIAALLPLDTTQHNRTSWCELWLDYLDLLERTLLMGVIPTPTPTPAAFAAPRVGGLSLLRLRCPQPQRGGCVPRLHELGGARARWRGERADGRGGHLIFVHFARNAHKYVCGFPDPPELVATSRKEEGRLFARNSQYFFGRHGSIGS